VTLSVDDVAASYPSFAGDQDPIGRLRPGPTLDDLDRRRPGMPTTRLAGQRLVMMVVTGSPNRRSA
jgi:hypothetical protein